jgi:uncharacterized protein
MSSTSTTGWGRAESVAAGFQFTPHSCDLAWNQSLGPNVCDRESWNKLKDFLTTVAVSLYRKADEQAAETRKILSVVQEEKDPASLDRKLREFLAGKVSEAQIAGQIRQLTSPAFRRMLTYDPAAALKKLACPVLALYAEKDLSVPAELNLPAMSAALESSGNKKFKVEELPDLNLLFQTADVGIGREANWTGETISPEVLKKIADWLSQQAASQ